MSVAASNAPSSIQVTEPKRRGLVPDRYRGMVQQAAVLLTIVLLFIIFTAIKSSFLTGSNISNILMGAVITGVQALGLSFVIATGGIDLTPGLGMAATGVITAKMLTDDGGLGLPIWAGVVIGILAGGLVGLINGALIAYIKMQPMIATLAMMMVCWGVSLLVSGGKTVSLSARSVDGVQYNAHLSGFSRIFNAQPIPYLYSSVIIFLALAVIAGIVMNKTVVGRYALAIGSNKEATRISGINTRRWEALAYVICGLFTGISGVLMASRLSSGNPTTGQGYEMYAIAAAVIGGTSLRGGRASIFGAVIGAVTIQTIFNGLTVVGAGDQWQKLVLGLVVLLAVFIDIRRRGGEE